MQQGVRKEFDQVLEDKGLKQDLAVIHPGQECEMQELAGWGGRRGEGEATKERTTHLEQPPQ